MTRRSELKRGDQVALKYDTWARAGTVERVAEDEAHVRWVGCMPWQADHRGWATTTTCEPVEDLVPVTL